MVNVWDIYRKVLTASIEGRSEETPAELKIPSGIMLAGDQVALLTDIQVLADRTSRRLGARTSSTHEVYSILQGAVTAGLVWKDMDVGRGTFAQAQSIFRSHVTTRNRLVYLFGVVFGFFLVAIALWCMISAVVWLSGGSSTHSTDNSAAHTSQTTSQPTTQGVPTSITLPLPKAEDVVPVFAFAGMGTVVSVLTRLRSLDLTDETSRNLVLISGASRPLIAVIFASVTFVMLKHQMIPLQIGTPSSGSPAPSGQAGLVLVASFLCGFSERFATDLLSSLPFATRESTPSNSQSPRTDGVSTVAGTLRSQVITSVSRSVEVTPATLPVTTGTAQTTTEIEQK
jgi:hypothetical protein